MARSRVVHTSVALAWATALPFLPAQLGAQDPFEGWRMIHSDAAYDYLVAPDSWSESPDEDEAIRVVRFVTTTMLVRLRSRVRPTLVERRRLAGLTTDGYDRYATTTRVIEARCSAGLYSVWEETDFDERGVELQKTLNERRWRDPRLHDDPVPMTRILDWACDRGVVLKPDDPTWERLDFDGRTASTYELGRRDGRVCTVAAARGSASALGIPLEALRAGRLTWSWWVDTLATGGDLREKGGDDYAARLLVNFEFESDREGWFSRLRHRFLGDQFSRDAPGSALSYVWSDSDPAGARARSPYTDRVGMVVVDSGTDGVGRWRMHERDLEADYLEAFGRTPPPVTSIAIMTDGDDTGTTASACYGEIRLSPRRVATR